MIGREAKFYCQVNLWDSRRESRTTTSNQSKQFLGVKGMGQRGAIEYKFLMWEIMRGEHSQLTFFAKDKTSLEKMLPLPGTRRDNPTSVFGLPINHIYFEGSIARFHLYIETRYSHKPVD